MKKNKCMWYIIAFFGIAIILLIATGSNKIIPETFVVTRFIGSVIAGIFVFCGVFTLVACTGETIGSIPTRPEPMFTPGMVACVSTLHAYYKYWEVHYFKKTSIAKAYALLCVNRPSEYSAVHLHYKRSIFDIGGRLMFNHIIEMPITDDATVIIDDNGTLDPSYYHE
jgi:hypothetical protein